MSKPRIIVFAYSELGYECLKSLISRGENVVAVYTHADNPDEKVWFKSVADLARQNSIPVKTTENLKDAYELEFISALKPDIIFSFYYRSLIPQAILDLPKLGAFNMHGSLLPKYRGRAPINWAVLNGETIAGATLHVMIDKADAGDIVDQEAVSIGLDDTAAQVQSEVTKAAVRVLERQIENIKRAAAPRISQNHSQSTYFGRRKPEDGRIDWNWPAARIHNLVRALTHPYPGAFGELFGEKVWIWKTRIDQLDERHGLIVSCADGKKIEILSLQFENEKEMSGKEFLEGHVAVGRKEK